MRSRSQRLPAALLFLLSISAALPVVRFCPLHWDQIDLATYATCSALPVTGQCRAPAAAPAANPSAPAACAAMATCPMRAHMGHTGAKCSACAPARPPAPPANGRHSAGPGWCFAEPLIAAATRTHAPAAPTPLALAAAIVTLEVPATVRPVARSADERPPAAPLAPRPPIRGPPSLLG